MPTLVAIIDAARATEELDEEAINEEMQDKETPEDGSEAHGWQPARPDRRPQ